MKNTNLKKPNKYLRLIVSLPFFVLSTTSLLAQPAERPPMVVRVAQVQIAEIAPTISVPGTIHSKDEAQVMASASGLLTKVLEEGTYVKPGDTVASVDRSTLLLQRAEQEALLERAKIAQRQLENNYKRQSELRASNLVSEFQVDETAANRDLAVADTGIIAIRIKQINNQLKQSNAKAPFAGVVTERLHRAGEEIARGTPLLRIISTDNLEVRAFVPLKHLSRTGVGDTLDVFNNEQRVNGKIRVLVPTGDVRSQTFEARVDIPAAEVKQFAVGQLVSVAIPIRSEAQSLAIPRDALVLRNDGAYVFRISAENKAERISVQLGDSAGDLIAVSGDLNEGDQVAVRGGESLYEGAQVEIKES